MTPQERALIAAGERHAADLTGNPTPIVRVKILGDRAHITCATGLEFDVRKRGTDWQLLPTSISDDALRRSQLPAEVVESLERTERLRYVHSFANGAEVDMGRLSQATADEDSAISQQARVAIFDHRERLLRDLQDVTEDVTQIERSLFLALGTAPVSVVDPLLLDQRVDDYSTARIFCEETGHDYQRIGKRQMSSLSVPTFSPIRTDAMPQNHERHQGRNIKFASCLGIV